VGAGLSRTDEQKMPAVALFQPREAMRLRNSARPIRERAQYPTMGAQFDLYFASVPGADTKLEVLDAKGGSIKTWSVAQSRSGARRGRRGRGDRRGGGRRNRIPPSPPASIA
jgi:hypothetical protein